MTRHPRTEIGGWPKGTEMTKDEKIAKAKDDVIAAARVAHQAKTVTPFNPQASLVAALNVTAALALLDEAEKPERPKLMTPNERVTRFFPMQVMQPGDTLKAMIEEERADIAAKVRELPRCWTRFPLGDDGLISHQEDGGRESVALDDVINLIEGR